VVLLLWACSATPLALAKPPSAAPVAWSKIRITEHDPVGVTIVADSADPEIRAAAGRMTRLLQARIDRRKVLRPAEGPCRSYGIEVALHRYQRGNLATQELSLLIGGNGYIATSVRIYELPAHTVVGEYSDVEVRSAGGTIRIDLLEREWGEMVVNLLMPTCKAPQEFLTGKIPSTLMAAGPLETIPLPTGMCRNEARAAAMETFGTALGSWQIDFAGESLLMVEWAERDAVACAFLAFGESEIQVFHQAFRRGKPSPNDVWIKTASGTLRSRLTNGK
jgi:hypothetical protein